MADHQPDPNDLATPSGETDTGATPSSDLGASLSWRCHPVKRRPLVSVAVSVFVIVVAVAVFYATDSRAFAVLALVILLLSLAKFYFPTRFQLTDETVTVKTTTQTLVKPWSQYRSYYPDKNGVLLSPFPEPSRLENFRGLYLMFADNRDEVIAFVDTHVGRKAPAPESESEAQA